MRKIRKSSLATLNLPSIKLEGSLFLPDQLEKAALGQAKHQTESDYQTPKGLKLKDDYSRAFQIACAQWKHFSYVFERSDVDAGQATQNFVLELLRDALGYAAIVQGRTVEFNDRHYPVNLFVGHIPIIVAPHSLGLDDADARFAIEGSGSRKKSAFQLAQELLNATDDHLWAIVTNGKQLRLLRDAASLTRPSFLEVDLEDVLQGQRFSEFACVWRLLHASRAVGKKLEHTVWEAWREAGKEEGTRVRDGLRKGVEQTLLTLGEGFIQHPSNHELRQQLNSGNLSKDAYFQQLLRLVYRLIFLFSVEERGLLHTKDESPSAQSARRAYAQGYAMARLRDACLKRRARNRFDDQWQATRIVFKGLADGEPRLALPALGGLFANSQCPQLDASSLSNAHLLTAMQHLRWASHNGSLAPVDYRNMGPEELGSVYESLLELVPEIDLHAKTFGFVGITSEGSTAGNARKTSGSYYTPDSLVQELIKSALEPVIEQRLKDNPDNPTEALLSIRVIDPACGSGHFLLAAARRLAEKLAELRAVDGVVKPQDYRHALREVVSYCIFGVDRNPMALELARTALWLEGFEEGRPLSFLDHHLQCGDALLGLIDLKALEYGIPKAAFKALSGDNKAVCKALNKKNTAELKEQAKKRTAQLFGQLDGLSSEEMGLAALRAIESMPQETTVDILAKENAYKNFLQQAQSSHLRHAADMVLGAFLLTKTEKSVSQIPTTSSVILELMGDQQNRQYAEQLSVATEICREARIFHWPLAFPQIFATGGFDCVLGNPPWERIKLQEEEFFATRNRDVAEAKNKAERGKRIQWLSEGALAKHLFPDVAHPEHECDAEKRLYEEFIEARRTAEAASVFMHIKDGDGGRYPYTGVGDVNTYALFAETISQIVSKQGRAGFIVPTGIATDNSTKAYFGHIIQSGQLASLFDFENREGLFPAVDSRMKFCLLTLGSVQEVEFSFFLTQTVQLVDDRRRFVLSVDDFIRINPNTLTCPVFRSRMDAELTRKIYQCVSVLSKDSKDGENVQNPWEFDYMTKMFDMADNSHEFMDYSELLGQENNRSEQNWLHSTGKEYAPLYEAKHIHLFDHRWASCSPQQLDGDTLSVDEKGNSSLIIAPRYWIDCNRVDERLKSKQWDRKWLIGWRDITNATNERTVIATIFPRVAVSHTLRVAFVNARAKLTTTFIACLSSIVLDYIARQKVGGTHLTVEILKQLPVFSPSKYTSLDLAFIVPRVLELTYTAHDMRPWAQDLGYEGEPFSFELDRRAILRAELDAYYAKLYGLTRDELRYILDPAEVMGKDYPSETFRVLKNKEMKEFGEYRTAKLVLREYDRMTLVEEANELYASRLVPPPGQNAQSTGHSPHGIIRDEDDGRLAGIVLSLIRYSGSISRQQLTLALTIAQAPANAQSLLSQEEINYLDGCAQNYPDIFVPERLDRTQTILRYLENTKVIRIEQRGRLFVTTQSDVSPEGIIVEEEIEAIAKVLSHAVREDEEKQSSESMDSETQIPTKRA